ncbi:MAG: rhomboid family intramembrane serine protease [Gammaproteobacteria bacterium]|jgi:membrane associated rhomboid family serine protease|nr:rhomboid family intramembrane serine protease [Gammaproteobacteria bacterium]
MNDDLRVVFESRNRQSCADRALVLSSLQIPYQMIDDGGSCALIVPAAFSAKAYTELQLYEEENPPVQPRPKRKIEYQDAAPGVVGYVFVVCLIAGMAGYSFFQSNWFVAGRVDGALIRNGEVWRLFTALTLHSGVKHLLSNIVFGVFFGLFAGRLLGSGIAWLAIVLAAATGNALNTMLLDATHRSIGASTAVFAALGLVAGYVWFSKLMPQERWSNRFGPIVGGLALLMYTGTGGENTDIGAHLLGFVSGFGAGLILTRLGTLPQDTRTQLIAGATAFGLIFVSWAVALGV